MKQVRFKINASDDILSLALLFAGRVRLSLERMTDELGII
jgi:hypothetical protein